MAKERKPVLTGGCQCGAVRYALFSIPSEPSICHCRMCQKAFGNYFAPLAGVPLGDLEWTNGQPGTFHSSEPRAMVASAGPYRRRVIVNPFFVARLVRMMNIG